tara:strand:+ start:441 stop:644 length:204 start_codon:yes stop_codon:yes gene_type:complete
MYDFIIEVQNKSKTFVKRFDSKEKASQNLKELESFIEDCKVKNLKPTIKDDRRKHCLITNYYIEEVA